MIAKSSVVLILRPHALAEPFPVKMSDQFS